RHQRVVDVDLLLDLVVLGDRLGAQHLLDLEDERVPVLEHDGDAVADAQAPVALELDDALAEIVAEALVQARAANVGAGDGAHGEARAGAGLVRGAAAKSGYSSPSRPFWKRPAWERSARARVSNHSAISSKPSSRAVLAKPG